MEAMEMAYGNNKVRLDAKANYRFISSKHDDSALICLFLSSLWLGAISVCGGQAVRDRTG